VQDSPIMTLHFKQKNIAMVGQVECRNMNDGVGLEVQMNEVGLTDTPDKVKLQAFVDIEGKYTFSRVPEDVIYNISIEKKHFCWAKDIQKIKVQSQKDIRAPVFAHRGYEVNFNTDFEFEAELRKESQSQDLDFEYFGIQKLTAGAGQFCLEESGLWLIKPYSECATFA
jgi:hypothetical protein